jgi:hypothetical protein
LPSTLLCYLVGINTFDFLLKTRVWVENVLATARRNERMPPTRGLRRGSA